MERINLWLKNLGLLFALLFAVELIFGYSGTMLMVKGLAIRHILCILAAVFLYIHCFCYTYVHKIKWFSLKDKTSVFGSFTVLDWAVLAFALSTVVSFLVMPQVYGGSLYLAKCEIFDSLCMLLFYFPIRFMISWRELSFSLLEKILLILISLLALVHIILYVGQTLNPNFIEGYFNILTVFSGGTAITPGIVLGHGGYPRVMYSTSIYLLLGVYLIIKDLPRWKVYHYLLMAIFLTALFTTMTKSLWYGLFLGIGIFTIFYVIKCLVKKQWRFLGQWFLILVGCFLFSMVLNATIFDGIVEARLNNSFVSSEYNNHKNDSDNNNSDNNNGHGNKYQELDNEGAVISNDLKVKQTELLLKAWQEHPIMGVGYGSYLKDFVRSNKAVFSYEMFLPAMLMKIGVVGMGFLLFVVLAAFILAIRNTKKDPSLFYAWLYLLIAFGLAIQTNPILLSFNGISMVLFLLWSAFAMKYEEEKERVLHD